MKTSIGQMFRLDFRQDMRELLSLIDHAVCMVEPNLKQLQGYPHDYRNAVKYAWDYAEKLALSVPGPVSVNLDSYALDPYVHALFPSGEFVSEAFMASRAIQDYLLENPASDNFYALMGMRRREKTITGMGLSGQVIQQEVPRQVVYFTSHTIENPAPTEEQARTRIAWSFFERLIGKVKQRIVSSKQELQSQLQEKDFLIARLRGANTLTRPALEAELSSKLTLMQRSARSLDLHNYRNEFETVLFNPQQHLRLNQSFMFLDSMGIRKESNESTQDQPIVFNDLIGFDQRNWTVTLVHCENVKSQSFGSRLELAYRKLSI